MNTRLSFVVDVCYLFTLTPINLVTYGFCNPHVLHTIHNVHKTSNCILVKFAIIYGSM